MLLPIIIIVINLGLLYHHIEKQFNQVFKILIDQDYRFKEIEAKLKKLD